MENINGQTKVIDGVVYQAVSTPVTPIEKVEGEIVEAPVQTPTVNTSTTQIKLSNGQNFKVEDVNINDPRSIITYGSGIQKQISAILESTAQLSVQQQKTFLSDEVLDKMVSFDDSLDDANAKAQEKVGLFRGLINKLRIGVNDESAKKEEAMKTYQGRYKDYTDNLKLVSDNLSQIAQDSLADISQRAELAQELTPNFEMLDFTVVKGKEKLEEYNAETARIAEVDKTPDGQAIVVRRTQLSNAFLRQINGLDKALTLYKSQVQEYLLLQDISMTTVQAVYDIIDKQKPVLQFNASVSIYNRLENERLNSILDVSNAANKAIEEGAQGVVENLRVANEIAQQSGFTIEAIETVKDALVEATSLVKERKQALVERDHAEQAALIGIKDELEKQKQEILGMIEDESVALVEASSNRGKTGRSRYLTTSSNSRTGRRR